MILLRRLIVFALAFALLVPPAFLLPAAQAQQVLPPVGPASGIACAYNSSLPSLASGVWGNVQCDSVGRLIISSSPTPSGVTQTTGNATGTTGAVVGTLAAATGKTTYICGFNVSAIGGTAAVGPITVAGLAGGSMVYQLADTTTGNTLQVSFNQCLPASAANTAITVTTTASAGATAVDVNSWGYQQ